MGGDLLLMGGAFRMSARIGYVYPTEVLLEAKALLTVLRQDMIMEYMDNNHFNMSMNSQIAPIEPPIG